MTAKYANHNNTPSTMFNRKYDFEILFQTNFILAQNNFVVGFIYGVPPLPDERVTLDVVATNKANYETGILKLIINVTSSMTSMSGKIHINSVRLKIDNLNLVSFWGLFKLVLWVYNQHSKDGSVAASYK